MKVRVLPDSAFGLIHGKAGVLRKADGSAIAFLDSVNESASAWKVNYALLWEDDSPETIDWVQKEFDALGNDSRAIDLACCLLRICSASFLAKSLSLPSSKA
jgi:hypothetical protein